MLYDVIYSFDCSRERRVGDYAPPNWRRRWTLTETDEGYEFGYLAAEGADPSLRHGKHRKYVAVLSEQEFIDFVHHTGVEYEDVQTLGMIGPGGWNPALSFRGDDPELIYQSAYVCPIPEDGDAEQLGLKPLTDGDQLCIAPLTDDDIRRRSEHNWHAVTNYVKELELW